VAKKCFECRRYAICPEATNVRVQIERRRITSEVGIERLNTMAETCSRYVKKNGYDKPKGGKELPGM